MKRVAPITAIALSLLLSGCKAASTAEATKDKDAILQLEDEQVKAFNSKDVTKLLANYMDDAAMISPGEATLKGKQALQGAITGMVSDPAFSLHFHSDDVKVAKSGDIAYTQGTYTLTITNPVTHQPMTDKGSYVTTYTKVVDGSWKVQTDAVISQTPPPMPAQ
jgi:uncharacterized protein (TIGR02246 family)